MNQFKRHNFLMNRLMTQGSRTVSGDHGQSALHPRDLGSVAARWQSEGRVVVSDIGNSLANVLNTH